MNDSLLSFLGQALAIAASAFAGAWCAFLFENRKAAHEERSERYAALRHAHLVVINQSSLLRSLRHQQSAYTNGDPNAWLTMLPSLSSFESPRLDVRSLVFTITDRHDPDLLNRLVVTEQQFLTFLVVLTQRDTLHAKLQDRLAELRAQHHLGETAEIGALESAVGQPLVGQLKATTHSLLAMLPVVLDGQQQRLTEIVNFSRKAFPDLPEPRHTLVPPFDHP